jgi:hypothetical protein
LALSVTIPASCRIGGGESGGNALKAKLVDLSYLRASFMERLVFSLEGGGGPFLFKKGSRGRR